MRIIVLVIGSLLLIVGVGGYLNLAKQWRVSPTLSPVETLNDSFIVELTPTFDAQQGYYSAIDPVSGELRINGRLLWESREILPAGLPITISPESVFVVGENELWVAFYRQDSGLGDDFGFQDEGAFSLDDSETDRESEAIEKNAVYGVRVRILIDQRVVLDETLWSIQGGVPGGLLQFQLGKKTSRSDRILLSSRQRFAEETAAEIEVRGRPEGGPS